MVRAQGIDADAMRLIGLALANALVALSGAWWRSTRGSRTSAWVSG